MTAMAELSLIPVGPNLKNAFARSRDALGHALGLGLLDGWPQFPESLDPHGPDFAPPWSGYLFAVAGEVVGNGGFVGPPDAHGCVEIGYEIAPARWNRGYATAAARSLVGLAWEKGATRVIAHSAAEWNASNRVMAKLGMRFVEALPNAELGTVWRFAVDCVPSPCIRGVADAG